MRRRERERGDCFGEERVTRLAMRGKRGEKKRRKSTRYRYVGEGVASAKK